MLVITLITQRHCAPRILPPLTSFAALHRIVIAVCAYCTASFCVVDGTHTPCLSVPASNTGSETATGYAWLHSPLFLYRSVSMPVSG